MTTLAVQSGIADSAGITPIAPTGRLLGYARVSRHDQDVTLQLDALQAAGWSGLRRLPVPSTLTPSSRTWLTTAAAGDVVVMWKLDRLARFWWWVVGGRHCGAVATTHVQFPCPWSLLNDCSSNLCAEDSAPTLVC